MADPITLGTIAGYTVTTAEVATALSYAGTAIGAVGALQSGRSQAAASRDAAAQQQYQSSVESTQLRKEQEARRAKQAAAYGASGIDISGTPAVYLATQAYEDELDVLTRKYTGGLKARALRKEAGNQLQEGYSKAGATILSGFD